MGAGSLDYATSTSSIRRSNCAAQQALPPVMILTPAGNPKRTLAHLHQYLRATNHEQTLLDTKRSRLIGSRFGLRFPRDSAVSLHLAFLVVVLHHCVQAPLLTSLSAD